MPRGGEILAGRRKAILASSKNVFSRLRDASRRCFYRGGARTSNGAGRSRLSHRHQHARDAAAHSQLVLGLIKVSTVAPPQPSHFDNPLERSPLLNHRFTTFHGARRHPGPHCARCHGHWEAPCVMWLKVSRPRAELSAFQWGGANDHY